MNETSLKNIVSLPPFKGFLCLGELLPSLSAALGDIAVAKNCRPTALSVAVIACEKDFLSVTKTVKDRLLNLGFSVEAFVSDEIFDKTSSLFSDFSVVICFGSSCYIASAASACAAGDIKLIAVPTNGVFADLFSDELLLSPIKRKKLSNIYRVIVDPALYKKLSRAEIIDSYLFCASFAALKEFFQVDILLTSSDSPSLKVVSANLSYADRVLSNVTINNISGVIVVAQLFIAKAISACKSLTVSAPFVSARFLSRMTGYPLNECVFGLIGPLLTSIAAYTHTEDKLLILPDGSGDIDKLSEVLSDEDKSLFFGGRVAFTDYPAIKENKKALKSAVGATADFKSAFNRLSGYKKGYSDFYRARHKRADLKKDDIITSLCLGGVVGSGALKLMYDDGFMSLLKTLP